MCLQQLTTIFVGFIGIFCCAASNVPVVTFLSSTHTHVKLNVSVAIKGSLVHVELHALHNVSDKYTCVKYIVERSRVLHCPETPSILKNNTVYNVRARLHTPPESGYSETVTARTAPGGARVVAKYTTPNSAVLFLEEVPGATEWTVRFHILDISSENVLAPNVHITNSRYVLVLPNLMENQIYGVQVRISEILNKTKYTESESPFSTTIGKFQTSRARAFGRVVLANTPFSKQLLVADVRSKVSSQYAIESKVEEVEVLELENLGGKTLCHYEIILKTPKKSQTELATLQIQNSSEFTDSQVRYKISGSQAYNYKSHGSGAADLSSRLSKFQACEWKDKRSWLFHNNMDSHVKYDFPGTTAEGDPSRTTSIQFHQAQVNFFDGDSGNGTFNLSSNSVYAIQHNYLIKYCSSTDEATAFYDRIYSAGNATNVAHEYTIVYTTGPDAMRNTSDAITAYNISSSEQGSRVEFSFQPVSRAIQYDFYIYDDTRTNIENLTLQEWEIDSSKRYQVRSSLELKWFVLHEVHMQVTTRLANASTATSSPSSLFVYSGYPNRTWCRVVEIFPNRFTVRWESVMYAEGYVVRVSNKTDSKTINSKQHTTHLVVSQGIDSGQVYSVAIAGYNRFGTSDYSTVRSTRCNILTSIWRLQMLHPGTDVPFVLQEIWSFSNIQPNSFNLSWQGHPSDSSYRVTVNASSVLSTETTSTHTVLSGLIAGAVHQVLVEFSDSNGKWTVLFQTYQITAPALVTGLEQTFQNLTAFSIAWNGNSDDISYEVEVRKLTVGIYTLIHQEKTSNHWMTLGGLTSGSLYYISLRVINSAGAGKFKNLNVTTGKDVPAIESIFEVTASSFKVKWSTARDASSYVVHVTDDRGQAFSQNYQTTSALLKRLQSGITYTVYVVAVYRTGLSNRSSEVNQITVPSPPSQLTGNKYSNDRNIRFSWKNVTGADLYYVRLTFSNSAHEISTAVTSTQYEVSQVIADVEYYISVLSSNDAGNSTASQAHIFSGYLVPDGVSVRNVTTHNILIGWNKINGAVEYQIGVKATSNDKINTNVKTASDKFLIDNLQPGTGYDITVTALYSKGGNASTNSMQQYTASQNPASISIRSLTSSTFSVHWDEPRQAGPTKYRTSLLDKYPESELLIQTLRDKHFVDRLTLYDLEKSSSVHTNITSRTEYILSDLQAGASYRVEVTTITYFSNIGHPTYENGQNKAKRNLTTSKDVPAIESIFEVTASSFKVKWSTARDASSYVVHVTDDRGQAFSQNYQTTSALLERLQSGITYTVYVVAVYRTGLSNRSSEVNQITVPSPPSQLTGNKYSNDRNIRFSWRNVTGADLYYVRLTSSKSAHEISTAVTSTQYEVSQVIADVEYYFSVLSSNDAGNSTASQAHIFSGYFIPNGVTIHNVTTHSILISWNAINGAVGYQIDARSKSHKETNIPVTARNDQLLIDSLLPGTGYDITVTALYSKGGDASINSIQQYTASQNPANISIRNMTNSAFSVYWREPRQAGPVKYKLTLYDLEKSSSVHTNITSRTEYVLSDLQAGASYRVEVTTITYFSNIGHPTYENGQNKAKRNLTTTPNTPQHVQARHFQDQNVTVTWEKARGAEWYSVLIAETAAQKESFSKTYRTSGEALQVLDLPLRTSNYSIIVSAVNIHGYSSEASEPVLLIANIPGPARPWIVINWWILLVACAVALILFVVMTSWFILRRKLHQSMVYTAYIEDDNNIALEMPSDHDNNSSTVESQTEFISVTDTGGTTIHHSEIGPSKTGNQKMVSTKRGEASLSQSPTGVNVTIESSSLANSVPTCPVQHTNVNKATRAEHHGIRKHKSLDCKASTKVHQLNPPSAIDANKTLDDPGMTPKPGENRMSPLSGKQSTPLSIEDSVTGSGKQKQQVENSEKGSEPKNRESIGISAFNTLFESMTAVPIDITSDPITCVEVSPTTKHAVSVDSGNVENLQLPVNQTTESENDAHNEYKEPSTSQKSEEASLEGRNRESIGLGRLSEIVGTLRVKTIDTEEAHSTEGQLEKSDDGPGSDLLRKRQIANQSQTGNVESKQLLATQTTDNDSNARDEQSKQKEISASQKSEEIFLEAGNRESIGLGRLSEIVRTLKVTTVEIDKELNIKPESENPEDVDEEDHDPLSKGPISMLWFDCEGEPGELGITDREEPLHDGIKPLVDAEP